MSLVSEKIEKIIKMGTLYVPSEEPIVSEKHLSDVIELMLQCARADPGIILTEVFQNKEGHVACFGLAALSSAGPSEFLSDKNVRSAAVDILTHKNPIQLLEFVGYLRSKTFGRGFGSRPQKWVR